MLIGKDLRNPRDNSMGVTGRHLCCCIIFFHFYICMINFTFFLLCIIFHNIFSLALFCSGSIAFCQTATRPKMDEIRGTERRKKTTTHMKEREKKQHTRRKKHTQFPSSLYFSPFFSFFPYLLLLLFLFSIPRSVFLSFFLRIDVTTSPH